MTPETGFDLTLTFDNGPFPEATPQVLDLLAARGIGATFFVIGEKLAGARALGERAHAEGHWLGNHTWDHSQTFEVRRGQRFAIEQIERCQRELGDLAHPDRLFRPNAGGGILANCLSETAVSHLAANCYSCVLWNAIPGDWRDREGWVETALREVASQPWSLMVLHEHAALARLEEFLDCVAQRGGRIRQDMPRDCVPIAGGVIDRENPLLDAACPGVEALHV